MNFAAILTYLKKNYSVALSAVVIIGCLGYNFVRSEQILRIEADNDDADIKFARMLKNLKNGAEVAEDLVLLKENDEQVEKRLFVPTDLGGNQSYFYQLEPKTGVAVVQLEQSLKALPSGKEHKKLRKQKENSPYVDILYKIQVRGNFEQVLNFMRNVEGGQAFAYVEDVSLVNAKSKGPENLVTATMNVVVLGKKS